MVSSLSAKDIMNPDVMRVREDMTVVELAAFLTDQEISGAPVEDEQGRLTGVVSLTDIVRAASSGGERYAHEYDPNFYVRGWEEQIEIEDLESLHFDDEGLLVRDIMTPSVFAIEADTPVAQVARSMMDSHLHRMLVVKQDEVVGIISTSDMLQLLADYG